MNLRVLRVSVVNTKKARMSEPLFIRNGEVTD